MHGRDQFSESIEHTETSIAQMYIDTPSMYSSLIYKIIEMFASLVSRPWGSWQFLDYVYVVVLVVWTWLQGTEHRQSGSLAVATAEFQV